MITGFSKCNVENDNDPILQILVLTIKFVYSIIMCLIPLIIFFFHWFELMKQTLQFGRAIEYFYIINTFGISFKVALHYCKLPNSVLFPNFMVVNKNFVRCVFKT